MTTSIYVRYGILHEIVTPMHLMQFCWTLRSFLICVSMASWLALRGTTNLQVTFGFSIFFTNDFSKGNIEIWRKGKGKEIKCVRKCTKIRNHNRNTFRISVSSPIPSFNVGNAVGKWKLVLDESVLSTLGRKRSNWCSPCDQGCVANFLRNSE